ncbi:hypothetical protein ONS95_007340 [Cadophora gregata]|uniref:uncharacterized protein n=1 Tax=Cadophora gregata TaxID=51156 RepID=UPI0026DBB34D|nr:uncharacterized protein ONS95_007340 [Cadophora gregata]KAK0100896.1 hypothetical protein ONS95_007340 [Cadophora gregata]KAK0117110.1 hypothetical protein ONS96_012946 [Cadophora gregata f. sp. sojae]
MEPVKRPSFRRQDPFHVPGQARHVYPSISSLSDHGSVRSSTSSRRYTSSCTSAKRPDPTLALSHAISTSSHSALLSILTHNSISLLQKTHSLHQAIAHGSKECIRILLDHGADINGLNAQGISPLQAAIREKDSRESIAKMLISRGADLTVGEPLHWATRRDWSGVVDMLCVWGVEVDRVSRSGAGSAASSEMRNRRNGREGVTALHIASYYDSLASAKVLIAHGAAVELHTSSGELALAEAIANRSIAMVDLLLSSGIGIHAAVDGSGGTPLMAACCLDDVGLVRCLTGHGAGSTIECRDTAGETAISVAAAWARKEVLECLVEAGADVNCRNEMAQTPLEIAVRKSRPVEAIEVLLRAGARRDEGVEAALDEAVKDAGGRFDFAIVDLLNSYARSAGRGRSRNGFMSETAFDEISEKSDETLRGDQYSGRVTRYVRKQSPSFTRSSTRGRSPASSISFDDGTSTAFDSSVWSEPEWDSSQMSRDRRIIKWSGDEYEFPRVRGKRGRLFGESWGDDFDSEFDGSFGSRSERRSGKRTGRGRGRGRVTNIVSFTVYA